MSKTVRVRVAVAIDGKGRWQASGYSLNTNAEDAAEAMESLIFDQDTVVTRWVAADIPIPEPETIEGEVVE